MPGHAGEARVCILWYSLAFYPQCTNEPGRIAFMKAKMNIYKDINTEILFWNIPGVWGETAKPTEILS